MRRLFSILILLPFLVYSAGSETTRRGWLVRVDLASYVCNRIGTGSNGNYMYTAAYDGYHKYFWKYVADPGAQNAPTLASLGLRQYCDLAGNPMPSPPYHSEFTMWLVAGVTSFVYDQGIYPEYRNLGLDRGPDVDYPAVSPIYSSNAGNPYTFDGGLVTGLNQPFIQNLNLSDILQGKFSDGSNGNSVPQFIYYNSDGSPFLSYSDIGGYEWQKNSETGLWSLKYKPASGSSVSGSSSVDLSPVISAIESQGGYIRDQLVALLGQAGNSWVYDCKLSLDQLYSLASSQGLLSSIDSQHLEYLDSNLNTITPAVLEIANKDFSPTINVAAPSVNIDTSSLVKESTFRSYWSDWDSSMLGLSSQIDSIEQLQSSYVDFIADKISSWDDIFNTWNNSTAPTISAPSGYEVTDENDGLPNNLKSFYGNDSPINLNNIAQVLGQYVSWGDSGAPQVFDLDFLSGFLNRIVGSVPSVGSDSFLFSVDFDLPYIGRIQRNYSWNDFPYVGEFRMFLVWVLYLFFGLACFKLLHKTLI